MLRVLHCIYDAPRNPWVGGGGSVRAGEIYRRLAGRLAVTVATGNYPDARDETIDDVRFIRLGARRPYAWSRWTYARAATRLLKRADYDVGIFDFSAYTPIRLPRSRPVGVVVHHLTGPTARQRWGMLLGMGVATAERWLLRNARWISTPSEWTREQLQPIIASDARVRVIGNGVSDELFGLERRAGDYVLSFGRLDIFQKGLDTLLEAMALLVADRPELRLTICGRGGDAAVRELVREFGLERNVSVRGSVSRAARLELFAGAVALLMPSRFEGFGIVAAEAMAAGVPLIASTAGSLPEIVSPPTGGVLVPPDQPAALAEAAAALLDDPDRRGALTRSARKLARCFSWDAVADEHLEFLEDVAAADHDMHSSPTVQ